jgi:hypothetical protein
VVTVALNVEGTQVTAEWHSTTEQEVLDLDVEVDIGEFFGLCGHAATEEVKVVARLDNHWTIEPVAETEGADT